MQNIIKNAQALAILLAGMVLSFLFFFQDVIVDLRDHFASGQGYSDGELIHLVFEAIAVVVLLFGILAMRQYTAMLTAENERKKTQLSALKEDFDDLIVRRFEQWGLTGAERDVALLLLRGLNTADIAKMRSTSVGTVKVQSHNVFQKAGVTSRVEFMSLFMDEFIDVGLGSTPT